MREWIKPSFLVRYQQNRRTILTDLHEIIDIKVGEAIKTLRVANGLSQQDAADKIGITSQQWQKYEKGENKISAGRLGTIAKLFDTDVNYFFEEVLTTVDAARLGKLHLQIMQYISQITCDKRLQYVRNTAKFMASWEKGNKKLN